MRRLLLLLLVLPLSSIFACTIELRDNNLSSSYRYTGYYHEIIVEDFEVEVITVSEPESLSIRIEPKGTIELYSGSTIGTNFTPSISRSKVNIGGVENNLYAIKISDAVLKSSTGFRSISNFKIGVTIICE